MSDLSGLNLDEEACNLFELHRGANGRLSRYSSGESRSEETTQIPIPCGFGPVSGSGATSPAGLQPLIRTTALPSLLTGCRSRKRRTTTSTPS